MSILIPYSEIDPETLNAMLEGFVTRDGTDYGPEETPLKKRVDQVHNQLERGIAKIVFDEDTHTFTILSKEHTTDL